MENRSHKKKSTVFTTILLTVAAIAVVVMLIVGLSYKTIVKDILNVKSVLIDAGHGGSDPGAISTVTGVHESDMNLAMARILADAFASINVETQMTRMDENALGDTKEDDMQARRDTIYSSDASIFISVHMNSFPENADVWGPQVFYQEGSAVSMALAQSIQDELNRATGGTRKASSDRLYVLNGDPMPAVLVECGFLTNEREAELLLEDDYMKLLSDAIVKGCR